MGSSLDYIGSLIVGGMVILIILSLNANITSSAFERNRDLISQEAAVNLTKIIEHDFYRMGYRTTGLPIVKAESLAIAFAADLGDDGTPDSLRYSVGAVTDLSTTKNANDLPLYRQVNDDPAINVAPGLVRFYFSYIDTGGNVMRYDSLKSAHHRDVVRLISVTFTVEPSDPVDTLFIPVAVQKTVRPKNLGGW